MAALNVKSTRFDRGLLTDPLFERTIVPVKHCLKDAGMGADQIDELVLVGGMIATAMSANVFFWIIPGQRTVVAAIKAAKNQ